MIGVGISILLALTALITALLMVLPSTANAAPHNNRGLTIRTSADPISAGQGVLIYGRLQGPGNAGKRIFLFHRIDPAGHFTWVSTTRTNGAGFYEFIRADGVVKTNRNWFVLGPHYTHSRTIHEWVSSVVTLNADTTTATTAQPVNFSGTVFPPHANQRVLLQEQVSTSGNGWKTLEVGYTNADSGFSIAHQFRPAGSYTLRAFFPNDPRNIAGESPGIDITVQQQQNPSFTINGSSPAITNGQTETITGTLYANGSTTTPQPNVAVTLYGRQGTGPFRALQTVQTDSTTGAYSFTTMPLHNSVYHVVASHNEKTANLYVSVGDVVSAALSAPTIAAGQAVKVTGTVTPAHNGHVIYLQEQNSAGQWVDVEVGTLSYASTFAFGYTPGQTGTFNFRVQITGGPWNVGGVSTTLPLTVSGVAPISSLPPAS
ncbi:MAG: hypothetical protein KGL15_07500 [Acidobacteriota bacterium]|nr:hypothetical protein [Acidobacteriota bacterium]